MTSQESTLLFNQIRAKYFERNLTCGKISVNEIKPDAAEHYTKWIYADNRDGLKRIIIIPEWQRTYYYNGESTYVITDRDHTFYIDNDTLAALRFGQGLDNISGLLLTRKKELILPTSENDSENVEKIEILNKNYKRISIELGDKSEYYTKDYMAIFDFNTESLDLVKVKMEYSFMDEPISNEYVLDTVYANESEVDQVWRDIQQKISNYSKVTQVISDEGPKLEIDFKAVMSQLTFLTVTPAESDYYLFDFYYIQCPPCLKSVPDLKRLRELYPNKTLSIISINPYDTKEKIGIYLDKIKCTYSSASINNKYVIESFGAFSYPTFVLFDHEGRLLWYQSGYDDQLVESVNLAIHK